MTGTGIVAEHIDTVSRRDHLKEFQRDYQPGQHVSAFGPTGRGKSLLMYQQLGVVCSPDMQVISLHGKIKGRDPVINQASKNLNLRVVDTLPGHQRQRYDRKVKKVNGYILVPLSKPLDNPDEETRILQREFRRAMRQNYRTTKRKTITHINEAHQTQYELKLQREAEAALMRGGPDNAEWNEAQRGRYLSYHTYNAPEHLIVFYDDDADNRKRYSDFGVADPDYIYYVTSGLKTARSKDGRTISQALYIRRGGGMYVIDM